jgi:hypothetical protein
MRGRENARNPGAEAIPRDPMSAIGATQDRLVSRRSTKAPNATLASGSRLSRPDAALETGGLRMRNLFQS